MSTTVLPFVGSSHLASNKWMDCSTRMTWPANAPWRICSSCQMQNNAINLNIHLIMLDNSFVQVMFALNNCVLSCFIADGIYVYPGRISKQIYFNEILYLFNYFLMSFSMKCVFASKHWMSLNVNFNLTMEHFVFRF